MTTAKHTPGPWKVSEFCRSDSLPVSGESGAWVHSSRMISAGNDVETQITYVQCDECDAGSKLSNFNTVPSREEMFANAALIAAAPELLEACEEALDSIASLCGVDRDECSFSDCEQLRAVIAKAKGES